MTRSIMLCSTRAPEGQGSYHSDTQSGTGEEEEFYRLLLLLLSYGTILAIERQTWIWTAPTFSICQESITHLYGALGDTRHSCDETDTGC